MREIVLRRQYYKDENGVYQETDAVGGKGDAYVITENDYDEIANRVDVDGMLRYIIKLVNNDGNFSLVNYTDNTPITFLELSDIIKDTKKYVVCVYGNSKLRPQYVSTSEMLFIGLDRAGANAKVLRMLFTPTRLEYTTYELAEAEDVYTKTESDEKFVLKTELTTDVYTKTESDEKYAPKYSYGTEDLEAGVSELETGKLYFVYE